MIDFSDAASGMARAVSGINENKWRAEAVRREIEQRVKVLRQEMTRRVEALHREFEQEVEALGQGVKERERCVQALKRKFFDRNTHLLIEALDRGEPSDDIHKLIALIPKSYRGLIETQFRNFERNRDRIGDRSPLPPQIAHVGMKVMLSDYFLAMSDAYHRSAPRVAGEIVALTHYDSDDQPASNWIAGGRTEATARLVLGDASEGEVCLPIGMFTRATKEVLSAVGAFRNAV
jgi:hypothetical protein